MTHFVKAKRIQHAPASMFPRASSILWEKPSAASTPHNLHNTSAASCLVAGNRVVPTSINTPRSLGKSYTPSSAVEGRYLARLWNWSTRSDHLNRLPSQTESDNKESSCRLAIMAMCRLRPGVLFANAIVTELKIRDGCRWQSME